MCYPYSIPHEKHGEYTLWLFNIAMVYMALIEIDGLPINSMVDLSMAMLVITRWEVQYTFSQILREFSSG
jgi:hypothetical protein